MGKPHDHISDELADFIRKQKVFFVATAPLSRDGHINLSPKGMDGTFAILDPRTVAYLDLTGSGIETIAHLRENGRIVVMFCAFEGKALILRLHGRGTVVLPGDEAYNSLRSRFPDLPGARSIIKIDVTRVSTSCGWGVPKMIYESERDKLVSWSQEKGPDGITAYQKKNNQRSIDGLPGIDF